MDIRKIIEAILFASGKPVSKEDIKKIFLFKDKEIEDTIMQLKEQYKDSAIEVIESDGKYAMQVREKYVEYTKKFAPMEIPKNLLKTLSIIAYHQPIKQSELRKIVGEKVYEHVKELQKRGFLKLEKDRRTKIIETSQFFYDYFGFDKKDKEKIKKSLYERIV
ncbi:MAG: SMC-Scp complex subunit ScpB [Thermoplasmatales archaeon]|nr:SMC-Scp complex subunit ScpB [Thermoplasmatales archaeon]